MSSPGAKPVFHWPAYTWDVTSMMIWLVGLVVTEST
jgi:hypothetical protein